MKQKKQKFKSAKRLLARIAFTPQTVQNHGLETFAPRFAAHRPRFSKIPYALAARSPHRSARFRPKLLC
ncbi:hypothetical protein [Mucilaginibacter sp. AK015]|uniref:hypothetical protein n=1 Tax=Mucilaginibacter sp. AK015 TaxID=2723072 RepID=UPI0016196FFE|nr:hypothetical protein [Mucilaginibacter sp. AK015]MBB5397790.1 hypothetical protein [Mucilaginibacter sp. AK015]